MRRSTRAVASLGLALLRVVVALVIVEAALRVFPPRRTAEYPRSIHLVRRDRPWLFGLRPGARVRLPPAGAIESRIHPIPARSGSRSTGRGLVIDRPA